MPSKHTGAHVTEPKGVPSHARFSEREGDGRTLVALCLTSFLASLIIASLAPFFPEIAQDLETTIPAIGQVVTLRLLVSAAVGLLIGPLADAYGHRRVMIVGVVAAAATLLGTGLAPSYPILLGVSFVGGLAGAILGGLSLAIAGSHFIGDARRRAMSWTIASLASAPIIGVPILTTVGSLTDWRVVFVGSGVLSLVAAWMVGAWLPGDVRHVTKRPHMRSVLAAYRPLLGHRPTLRLLSVTAIRSVGWLGLLTYMGAFLADVLALTTRQIGLVYMVAGSGYFLGSLVAGGRVGRFSPRPLAATVTCALAFLLGVAFTVSMGPVLTTALLTLAAFGGGLGWVVLTTLLATETPAGAGTTMVFNGSLFNLGSAGGGAIGGILLSLGGYDALGLGLSLFILASAMLVWMPSRQMADVSR